MSVIRTLSRCLLPLALLAPLSAAPAQEAPAVVADIPYASGGIGVDERKMLESAQHEYSLKLQFAITGSNVYVSDVTVTIARGDDAIFQVEGVGPWLLLKLPAGTYQVNATLGEQSKTVDVQVPASGLANRVIAFQEQ